MNQQEVIGFDVSGGNVTYFESFGVEHIAKEVLKIWQAKKYYKKHFQNTSIRFNNVWILWYQIC